MIKKLVKVLCMMSALQVVQSSKVNEFEDPSSWIGAEDFESNEFPESNIFPISDADVVKSSRQDHEDVEIILNPGPLFAPDIIQSKFVDSRISLSNIEDAPQVMSNANEDVSNSIRDDEVEEVASDDQTAPESSFPLDLNEMMYNSSIFQNTDTPMNNEINDLDGKQTETCRMKFDGIVGSFNMNFEKDCVIQITAPNELSRLILTCSPIELGDCSRHKDSLSINVLGDVRFKQNSFLYCGYDANIRAISFKNKLAIRVKKTPEIVGSTFCTFHSRKYREFDPNSSSIPCGRLGRAGKIIGGRRVPPGLFPWAAQLDITRTDGSQTGCTGTIVSPHYILTAAHCMKRAESVSAFMGGTDRLDIIGTEVLIQAEKYILHKKWSSRTLTADIALVKLTQPVQYSEDISPICLPEGKLLSDDLSGRRGVAIGWGRTETKKKAPRRLYRVKLPLLSDSKCRNIYRRFYIPKVMMCTDSKKDAAICYGMKRNSTRISY